jgi:hypothetical protein
MAWQDGMPEWLSLEAVFPDVAAELTATPTPARPNPAPARSTQPTERSFAAFALDAFEYPFRGDGMIILLAGTLLRSVIGAVPAVGMYGTITAIAQWGYLLPMLQSVVQGNAQDVQILPRWPGLTGVAELFETQPQWFVVLAVCFGPAYGVDLAATAESANRPEVNWPVILGLAVAGGLYLPMAVLGVAMFDSVSALDPRLVLRSIFAVPGNYLLLLAAPAGLVTVAGAHRRAVRTCAIPRHGRGQLRPAVVRHGFRAPARRTRLCEPAQARLVLTSHRSPGKMCLGPS